MEKPRLHHYKSGTAGVPGVLPAGEHLGEHLAIGATIDNADADAGVLGLEDVRRWPDEFMSAWWAASTVWLPARFSPAVL